MKPFIYLVLFMNILAAKSSLAVNTSTVYEQTIINYIRVEFPKINKDQLFGLVEELNSYDDKVLETIYYPESRQLVIYYSPNILLDDIYSIIGKYVLEFHKIGGTEI